MNAYVLTIDFDSTLFTKKLTISSVHQYAHLGALSSVNLGTVV